MEPDKRSTVSKDTAFERRTSTRFVKDIGADFAVIWYPAELAATVEVHDESLGGLGLLVEQPEEFSPNREIGIVYAGCFYRAFVRHTRPFADGRTLIGLDCTRAE